MIRQRRALGQDQTTGPQWPTAFIIFELVLVVVSWAAAFVYLSIDSGPSSTDEQSWLDWTIIHGEVVGVTLLILGPLNFVLTLMITEGDWQQGPRWFKPTLIALKIVALVILIPLILVALLLAILIVLVIIAFTKGGSP